MRLCQVCFLFYPLGMSLSQVLALVRKQSWASLFAQALVACTLPPQAVIDMFEIIRVLVRVLRELCLDAMEQRCDGVGP